MKKNVVVFVVIFLFLLAITAIYMLLTQDQISNNPEIVQPRNEIEKNYRLADTTSIENIKGQLIPLIAKGKWHEGASALDSFFSDVNPDDASVSELRDIHEDLTVLNQMSYISPDMYPQIFTEFKSPYTFLAAMIYYPPSVKIHGFASYDSLVPTTTGNDVTFLTEEPVSEQEEKDIRRDMPEVLDIKNIPFLLDGNFYSGIVFKNEKGWLVWKVVLKDGETYFNDVKFWEDFVAENC